LLSNFTQATFTPFGASSRDASDDRIRFFYIYFPWNYGSFEKPYVALLNSANLASWQPLLINTLAARGLEEQYIMRVSLIFVIIVSFMLFIVLLLSLMYFFQRHSDSRFMILKNNLPNLLGLCHFPLNT
jgi:hypothetical protein